MKKINFGEMKYEEKEGQQKAYHQNCCRGMRRIDGRLDIFGGDLRGLGSRVTVHRQNTQKQIGKRLKFLHREIEGFAVFS